MEFKISVKPGVRPIKQKTRTLNPSQLESLRKQLDKWERNDVITPSFSAWASPMVPARKSGSPEIRWCVDYRQLNNVTIPDSYPLPRAQENLEKLNGCKIFSALDAQSAYHCIPVADDTQPLLSFTSPLGLFTFRRLPFGPTSAPGCFSRFMNLTIGKLRSPWVSIYLDDVLLATPELELHLKELRDLLEAHRTAGLKLNIKKTSLFTTSTDYLGYKVSERGIELKPSYVQDIVNWPTPRTPKDVRRFVGFSSYYRDSIKRYSELTAGMNEIKNKKTLVWTTELDKDFKELKRCFETFPIRSYPDFSPGAKPFILTTDYSKNCVAAVLSQVQGGREKLLSAKG